MTFAARSTRNSRVVFDLITGGFARNGAAASSFLSEPVTSERKADVGKLTTRYRVDGEKPLPPPPPPLLLLKLVAETDCGKCEMRGIEKRREGSRAGHHQGAPLPVAPRARARRIAHSRERNV